MFWLTWCSLIRFPQVPWVSYLAPSVTICRGTPTDWNVCVKSSPASDFADMCPTWANYLSVTDTCDIVCPLVDFVKGEERIIVHRSIQSVVSYFMLLCAIPVLQRVYSTTCSLLRRYFGCICGRFQANAPSPCHHYGISFMVLLLTHCRNLQHITWCQMHLHRSI